MLQDIQQTEKYLTLESDVTDWDILKYLLGDINAQNQLAPIDTYMPISMEF